MSDIGHPARKVVVLWDEWEGMQQRIAALEAERDTLRQRLATVDGWEDVPDGTYTIDQPNERIGFNGSDITLRHNGLWIRVRFDYKDVEMFLPDNWRIQRKKGADNE